MLREWKLGETGFCICGFGIKVLKFPVLLPESYSKMGFRELGYENGKWMELVQNRI